MTIHPFTYHVLKTWPCCGGHMSEHARFILSGYTNKYTIPHTDTYITRWLYTYSPMTKCTFAHTTLDTHLRDATNARQTRRGGLSLHGVDAHKKSRSHRIVSAFCMRKPRYHSTSTTAMLWLSATSRGPRKRCAVQDCTQPQHLHFHCTKSWANRHRNRSWRWRRASASAKFGSATVPCPGALECSLGSRTNLDRSITVRPTKWLNAKRRACCSKTQLVGSHIFVCWTRAGTKAKQPKQEPTQPILTAEGFVVLVDFETFCARLDKFRKYPSDNWWGMKLKGYPMFWCFRQHFWHWQD